jgi:hypothetical protein
MAVNNRPVSFGHALVNGSWATVDQIKNSISIINKLSIQFGKSESCVLALRCRAHASAYRVVTCRYLETDNGANRDCKDAG